ncbi:MAG TPA: hypothetical protein VJR89_35330 [Polyangiales bacterium]|nr:hypothetical protein [Polyangiales bacterium]
MRQLQLPFYEPFLPAPERAVITLLHAALAVTEQVLRDEHPLVGQCVAEPRREPGEAVILSAARLIVGRCIELRELLDLYDTLLERLRTDDDEIPF